MSTAFYFLVTFMSLLMAFVIILGSLVFLLWAAAKLIPKKAGDGLSIACVIIAILVWLALVGALLNTSEYYSRTDVEYQRDK